MDLNEVFNSQTVKKGFEKNTLTKITRISSKKTMGGSIDEDDHADTGVDDATEEAIGVVFSSATADGRGNT